MFEYGYKYLFFCLFERRTIDIMNMQALQLAYNSHSAYESLICVGLKAHDQEDVKDAMYIPISELHKLETIKTYKTYDYYITANTLKFKKRRNANLYSFHNIVVDIDLHVEMNTYERQEILEEFLFRVERDTALPTPNIQHFTGRGLQLWWCLEEIYGAWIFLYKATINKIIQVLTEVKNEYSKFQDLEIDGASKNVTGYFRLFNTVNTKNWKETQTIIKKNERYALHDLIELVPDVEKINEPVTNIKNVGNTEDYIALNHKRSDFIKWLIQTRDRQAGAETRDKLLLLYYNACVQFMSKEMAKTATLKLNRELFKEPLDRTDNIFSYIDRKGYLRFKNDTWFSFLDLNEEEKKKYEETQNSNSTRDLKRKQKKEERNNKILELSRQGISNTKIAEELGISRKTVIKVLSTSKTTNENKLEKRRNELKKYIEQGLKTDEICNILNISRRTYYLEKKKLLT